eukprot:TRINITY_DN4485_c0_g1_i1.p1 TRINITY_DN4485_c0_g1~~TRINITY_DN4485_c0_g1_i1.p1  ORF type:complete len:53 (+),score=10.29 TRINITY_DN4485_c0_g1_i1:157-315(+)
MKFTFVFLNLAKIHISISKCTEEGSIGLGNIHKKNNNFSFKKEKVPTAWPLV